MSPKDIAQTLLKEYWDGQLPIRPEAFLPHLNLQLVLTNDLGKKSGCFVQEERTIYVNESEGEERRRFTIAHELGHYCLGHGTSDRDTSSGQDWILEMQKNNPEVARCESQANDFAGELLMPAALVRYFIEKEKIWSIKQLSETFQVSTIAMSVRLFRLGFVR